MGSLAGGNQVVVLGGTKKFLLGSEGLGYGTVESSSLCSLQRGGN